jgi:fluoride exporter
VLEKKILRWLRFNRDDVAMTYFLIAIGSALGGMARYWAALAVAAATGSAFPWGTMAVNVIGSALIGSAMGAMEPGSRWQVSMAARDFVNQFFMIGVLGGFTTFSSFSLQTLTLMREQQWMQAGTNVLMSVVLCLLAVAVGYWLATTLLQARS